MAHCVFFDLDGTLTDPQTGITTCIQFAMERLGYAPPANEELLWCIGPPLKGSLATLMHPEVAEQALGYYRERFSEVGWRENAVYAGVPQMLARLRDSGLTLHVATSKPHHYARQIIEHFALREFFGEVFGAELDGTRSNKTELLQHAMGVTGCVEGAMVGDRLHDMYAGAACGLSCVGVSYGFGSYEELSTAGAASIVDKPSDVPAAIDRCTAS